MIKKFKMPRRPRRAIHMGSVPIEETKHEINDGIDLEHIIESIRVKKGKPRKQVAAHGRRSKVGSIPLSETRAMIDNGIETRNNYLRRLADDAMMEGNILRSKYISREIDGGMNEDLFLRHMKDIYKGYDVQTIDNFYRTIPEHDKKKILDNWGYIRTSIMNMPANDRYNTQLVLDRLRATLPTMGLNLVTNLNRSGNHVPLGSQKSAAPMPLPALPMPSLPPPSKSAAPMPSTSLSSIPMAPPIGSVPSAPPVSSSMPLPPPPVSSRPAPPANNTNTKTSLKFVPTQGDLLGAIGKLNKTLDPRAPKLHEMESGFNILENLMDRTIADGKIDDTTRNTIKARIDELKRMARANPALNTTLVDGIDRLKPKALQLGFTSGTGIFNKKKSRVKVGRPIHFI